MSKATEAAIAKREGARKPAPKILKPAPKAEPKTEEPT
jgi:hypothetical protein